MKTERNMIQIWLLCVAILQASSSAKAQNLFEADFGSGNIYEFTPSGVRSTFASGLSPYGIAFNNAGNLFVADAGNGTTGNGNIYEFTPSGVRTTFASGLTLVADLSFNSGGN